MSVEHFDTLRMIEDIATTLGNQNKLTHKGAIYHAKALPTELQKKLAVLRMLEPQQSEVVGVGLRSGKDSFWIYM